MNRASSGREDLHEASDQHQGRRRSDRRLSIRERRRPAPPLLSCQASTAPVGQDWESNPVGPSIAVALSHWKGKSLMAEASVQSILLVQTVSKRLVQALCVLLALILSVAVLASATGSIPEFLKDFSVPLMVALSGAIGGFVSIQRRLKRLPKADLSLFAESWVYIALAPLVGAVLALLVYLLFLSDLLGSGGLFPVFVEDSPIKNSQGIQRLFDQHGKSFQDYAKLLVWAFVAGFSETFVTNIIGQFEQKAPTVDDDVLDA